MTASESTRGRGYQTSPKKTGREAILSRWTPDKCGVVFYLSEFLLSRVRCELVPPVLGDGDTEVTGLAL